jgi:ketosteroid isomerase-like protein
MLESSCFSEASVRISLLVPAIAAIVSVAIFATGSSPASPAATPSADALRQLEAEFMQAAADHGAQGYMSYYADNAVELPNGADILQGKATISKTMGFLDQKDNHLTWTPVGADMSVSGDLGYTYGTYEFHSKDKDGKPVVSHGKYATVWKKQKDGSWKVAMDMGNTSPTPN